VERISCFAHRNPVICHLKSTWESCFPTLYSYMGFGWCMNKIFQAHYNRNLWPSSSCLSSFKMLPFLFCLLRFFSTFSHSTWESLVVVYHLAETGMVFFSDKEVSVMRRVPEPVILKQDCFPESLKILTGSFFFVLLFVLFFLSPFFFFSLLFIYFFFYLNYCSRYSNFPHLLEWNHLHSMYHMQEYCGVNNWISTFAELSNKNAQTNQIIATNQTTKKPLSFVQTQTIVHCIHCSWAMFFPKDMYNVSSAFATNIEYD